MWLPLWTRLRLGPTVDIPTASVGAAVRAPLPPPPSPPYYLSLRRPLGAAVKVASFVVQLAQDHVVLEEKLVSHTESAERQEKAGLSPGLSQSQAQKSCSGVSSVFSHRLHHILRSDYQQIPLFRIAADIQVVQRRL